MESAKNLKVTFSGDMGDEVVPSNGEIIIIPSPDPWNDFSYKIKCTFMIRLDGSKLTHQFGMLLGFLSPLATNGNNTAYDALIESPHNFLSQYSRIDSSKLPQFFTMQPDMQAYRSLVEKFGVDQSANILNALNDLVFYKKKSGEEWYSRAVDSKLFKLGFMRNSEPFFAFHNADSILDGVENENLSSISDNLELSFKLDGFETPHNLHLKFNSNSLIPRRIAVLIGKNGLGKSESLKAFCRGALQYADDGLKLLDSDGKRPLISRVIAMATPGETSNTFPLERQKTQKLYYRRLILTRKGTRSMANALVQLARSDDSIGERSRWDLFAGALSKALPFDDIHIKLKNDEFFPIKELRDPGGEQHSLEVWGSLQEAADPVLMINQAYYPLSSGQLTFLKFALMSCLHIENGSFVLMDEPETHLHPNMISDFIGLLNSCS